MPASGVMGVNGGEGGGRPFALFLLKIRQLWRQRCRLMTAFTLTALCLHQDNGHVLRDSVAVKE